MKVWNQIEEPAKTKARKAIPLKAEKQVQRE